MSITYSSCFYIIKSKLDFNVYIHWMNNFFSIVHNFNLVVYTDENSNQYINTNNNPRIMVIIKPLEEFYNYKYKEQWIANHNKNSFLNNYTGWELNMLWSEKIWFVNETFEKKYYDTEFYGWCDIGYFRNNYNDLHTSTLLSWSKSEKILSLDKNRIYYACVSNDNNYINNLFTIVNNKNCHGLPSTPIPPDQNSIAGGFFIIHKNKINWWKNVYDTKLELYFKHNYLVKDDQIILVDCIYSNLNEFMILRENDFNYNNWFMFQRFLN